MRKLVRAHLSDVELVSTCSHTCPVPSLAAYIHTPCFRSSSSFPGPKSGPPKAKAETDKQPKSGSLPSPFPTVLRVRKSAGSSNHETSGARCSGKKQTSLIYNFSAPIALKLVIEVREVAWETSISCAEGLVGSAAERSGAVSEAASTSVSCRVFALFPALYRKEKRL